MTTTTDQNTHFTVHNQGILDGEAWRRANASDPRPTAKIAITYGKAFLRKTLVPAYQGLSMALYMDEYAFTFMASAGEPVRVLPDFDFTSGCDF